MTVNTSLERVLTLPDQVLTLRDWPAEGHVLNIGGGAGVISELKGPAVVVISPDRRQLEDGRRGPLKIVMDPARLQFLDGSFHDVTSFFGLMDIPDEQLESALREVYRVLVPGGLLRVWDVALPAAPAGKDLVAFHLAVYLPQGRRIAVAYGSRAPNHDHDLSFYLTQFGHAGFCVVEQEAHDNIFALVLQKPVQ